MRTTITIAGHNLPVLPVRVLTFDDALPMYFSELEGPMEAFALSTRGEIDFVKVTDPSAVTIKRLEVAR